MRKEDDFEKQKIAYDKAIEMHKYYLSWRQFLFAGYIAIIGVLIFKCCDMASHHVIRSILLLLAALTSLVFFLLDKRNSELYHICQKVASRIEDDWFGIDNDEQTTEGNIKLYKRLDLSHTKDKSKQKEKRTSKYKITHTKLLSIVYLGTFFSSLVLSFILYFLY